MQLIHVGDIKISKKFKKVITSELNNHKQDDDVFTVIDEDFFEDYSDDLDKIKSKIEESIVEYGYNLFRVGSDEPIIKLSGISRLKFIRQTPGKESTYGFDAHDYSSYNKALTIIINLSDITEDGELEFHFQEVQIRPSENEIVIFPASFTHLHKFNKTKQEKIFIKASCFF